MLADAGASLVIVGHSERRAGHHETDAMVAAKALAAIRAGLEPIICVGETLEQRQAGQALEVVTAHIRGSIAQALAGAAFAVAYEPIWAIGSGLTASLGDIEEMHAPRSATTLRDLFEAAALMPIHYQATRSKPDNAREILAAKEVGSALVGGASLKAADFLRIIAAAGVRPSPTAAARTPRQVPPLAAAGDIAAQHAFPLETPDRTEQAHRAGIAQVRARRQPTAGAGPGAAWLDHRLHGLERVAVPAPEQACR